MVQKTSTKAGPLALDLGWVAPYIEAINSALSVDQLLRKLHQDLEPNFGLRTAQVFTFDTEGLLMQSGGYGVPGEYQRHLKFSMDELHPVTDCARSEVGLIINSVKDFINRYPDSINWSPGPAPSVAVPLRSGAIVDGVLYTTFSPDGEVDEKKISTVSKALHVIGGLCQIALRKFSPQSESAFSTADDVVQLDLTNRQLRIAKMIAEGLTNKAIASELGFSEATIRYETIKLYERLRVKNRSHAAARIHQLGIG